jgi:hypothetical protein
MRMRKERSGLPVTEVRTIHWSHLVIPGFRDYPEQKLK